MFKRILVPWAVSDRETPAITCALQMASQNQSTVALLHVIETLRDSTFEELKDFYAEVEQRAREGMSEVSALFSEKHIPCTTHISFGPRVAGILDFAEKSGSELIILQSHKVSPQVPESDIGTISHRVGILAPIPVLLVK